MDTNMTILGNIVGDLLSEYTAPIAVTIINIVFLLILTVIIFSIFRWVSMRFPVFDTDKSYISLKEKYKKLEIKYDLLVERYTKLLKEYNRLKSEK